MNNQINKDQWSIVKFGDVVNHIKDRVGDITTCGLTEYIRGEHFKPGHLRLMGRSTIGDGKHGSAFNMRFRQGDVLYVSRNPQLRKAAIADFQGICSNTTYVCRAKTEHLLQELLPFIMQTEPFVEYTIRHKRGSTNFYLNWSDMAGYEFALPPLEEQRRIVEVCNAHENLKNKLCETIEYLGSLKESLLNQEFPSAIDQTNNTTLFAHISSGDLEFQTGPFGTVLSASEYLGEGWPIVNPSEMRDGTIHNGDMPCVDDTTAQRLEKYRIREGDILLARKGDFSKAVIAEQQHEGWIAGSDTIRLRLLSNVLVSDYLYWFIQSPMAGRMLKSFSHGTVMPGLNEKMLGRLSFVQKERRQQLCFIDLLSRLKRQEINLRRRLADHRSVYEQTLSMFHSINEGGLS